MDAYGEAQVMVTPAQARSLTRYYWWALVIPLLPELFFGPRLRRRNHVLDQHLRLIRKFGLVRVGLLIVAAGFVLIPFGFIVSILTIVILGGMSIYGIVDTSRAVDAVQQGSAYPYGVSAEWIFFWVS